jgi:Holin of 3TMs, for gene-transfer release
MNPIWSFLSNLISPVTNLIDELHTSDEEKLKIQAEMLKLQTEVTGRVMDYESKLLDAQSQIVLAEAKGESWLQRNWRPLMMVWFAVLLGMYWFGVTPPNITQETLNHLFTLLEIGIGGYIVGRSAEKIIPQVVATLGKNKE